MKKIILAYSHYLGWGDSIKSIFNILNCGSHIRKNMNNVNITFIILDNRSLDIEPLLKEVFDFNYFKSFFDKVTIQKNTFENFNNNGVCKFENELYNRIYSCYNYDLKNNIPGCFDVYVNDIDFFKNIPFLDLTFDDTDKIIIDYPIFNDKIISLSEEIINGFGGEFSSICYRSHDLFPDPFKIKNLQEKISQNGKKFFLYSNSIEARKQLFLSHIYIKMIRPFDSLPSNHFLDGFPVGDNRLTDAIFAVCELYIMGHSKEIFYGGEMGWISYFTWYAKNIKKIKIIVT